MKVIKIILGILLMVASLPNLRHLGDAASSAYLMGRITGTALIFFTGAYLLYSGLKRK